MQKLRKEFWRYSQEWMDWCTDEELRVLGQRVRKEMENRAQNVNDFYDDKLARKGKRAK